MDLRQYLKKLVELSALSKVKAPVDSNLELAALCRREFKKPNGGSALFFSSVDDGAIPVVANLFGSYQRLGLLLHSNSLSHFSDKLSHYFKQQKGSARERLQLPGKFSAGAQTTLQLVEGFDLTRLPVIRSWPAEGGRYLTLALTLTQNPQTGTMNLGLYRAQIISAHSLAVNFAPGSGAAEHLAVARESDKSLPISLILGSDPILFWLAAAPLPKGCNEFAFCRALLNLDINLTQCISQPLQVPTDAEIVIEGEIRPDEVVVEGPFGNHTGQYVTRRDCPLMQVTAVRHRPQPILPVTVVGPPPSENVYLAKANEALIREMFKIDYPQVTDLWMPQETFFHNVAILAIKPQTAAQVKELVYALWQESPFSNSRLLVLLDEDIAISSPTQSWWRTINRLKSERVYQDNGRTAIDATGVDPSTLVVEDQQTQELLLQRQNEYDLT
ncbi:MAG: UbiD family decarboxylase [Deltaproteobacteria bacterium]|nr:UbiD family decarboxylase [Deltaproteobacteria bacterium]MCW9049249.1 UbiD family decarboxylase [Deltaproteobacteria bacterium]